MNAPVKNTKINPIYKIETALNEANNPYNRITMPMTTLGLLVVMIIALVFWFYVGKTAELSNWQFASLAEEFKRVPDYYWVVALSEVLPFSGMLLTLLGGLQQANRIKVWSHATTAQNTIADIRKSPDDYTGYEEEDLELLQSRTEDVFNRLEADKRFERPAMIMGIVLIVIGLGFSPFT